MMAFVVIGSVIGKSTIKGILSTLLGIMVSLIKLDPITGDVHMTMGRDKKLFPIMLRSSGVGSLIGMMPGLGSAVACFVVYGGEHRRSKSPEKWGTGIIEGIAAPESANNTVSGPSVIPLLTLGVPGSTIAAILIGVFMIHGIQVGPSIFQTDRELIFGLFAAGLLGIALYGLMGYFGGPIVGRAIAYFPPRLIYPFIFLTAFIASYSARQSVFDIGLALLFGVIGYLMRRADFSAPAFIIAFVLAKGATYRPSRLAFTVGRFGLAGRSAFCFAP